jgi:phosphoribosylanthranilate isomerase
MSGGIGIDDAKNVLEFSRKEKNLFSLDVNSKFEVSPGVKDMDLIKQFLKDIK